MRKFNKINDKFTDMKDMTDFSIHKLATGTSYVPYTSVDEEDDEEAYSIDFKGLLFVVFMGLIMGFFILGAPLPGQKSWIDWVDEAIEWCKSVRLLQKVFMMGLGSLTAQIVTWIRSKRRRNHEK